MPVTVTVIDINRSDRSFDYSTHGHYAGRTYVTSRWDTSRIKTLQAASRAEDLPLTELRSVAAALRDLLRCEAFGTALRTEFGPMLGKATAPEVPAEDAKLRTYVAQLHAIAVAYYASRDEAEEREVAQRAEQQRLYLAERARIQEEMRQAAEERKRRETQMRNRKREEAATLRATIARKEYVFERDVRQLVREGFLTEADLQQAIANRQEDEAVRRAQAREAARAYAQAQRVERRRQRQQDNLAAWMEQEERRFLQCEATRRENVSLAHTYGHRDPEYNCPKWHKALRRTALM